MSTCRHPGCPDDHCHIDVDWSQTTRTARASRQAMVDPSVSTGGAFGDATACRGLFGFVLDGEVKAGLHPQRAEPQHLGREIVSTWAEVSARFTPQMIRAMVRRLQLVDGSRLADGDWVCDARQLTFFEAMAPFSGDLFATLSVGVMVDGGEFGKLGLWCEWGYLVDLDRDVITVFRGHQTEPHHCGPWGAAPQSGGCYGIAPITEASFDELDEHGWDLLEHRIVRSS